MLFSHSSPLTPYPSINQSNLVSSVSFPIPSLREGQGGYQFLLLPL